MSSRREYLRFPPILRPPPDSSLQSTTNALPHPLEQTLGRSVSFQATRQLKHRWNWIKTVQRSGRWSLLILCVVTLCHCASLRNPQNILNDLGPRETRPLFWHVEGHEGTDLYIIGSIPLAPRKGWEYPAQVEAAFKQAQALVVEVDPNELSQPLLAQMIQVYGQLPPGQYLRNLLEPQTWSLLASELKESRLRVSAVNRMRPWLLSELLVLEQIRKSGYLAQGGAESYFIARAGQRSIVPLESIQMQMASLANLPLHTQQLALLDTLRRSQKVPSEMQELVNAWRAGDEKGLEQLTFQTLDHDEAFVPFFETMVFQRNNRMQAQLEVLLNAKQHSGESVFVSIDVAHLIGKRGICQGLRKKGYQVTQIHGDEWPSFLAAAAPVKESPLGIHP